MGQEEEEEEEEEEELDSMNAGLQLPANAVGMIAELLTSIYTARTLVMYMLNKFGNAQLTQRTFTAHRTCFNHACTLLGQINGLITISIDMSTSMIYLYY